MAHYSVQQWFDFAYGMVSSEEKKGMQAHVDSGCLQCWKVLDMWRRSLEIGRRESAYTPPVDAVRIVKAAYATAELERPSGMVRIARLVFDSFRQPVPAAVRSGGVASRQLVHEADPFVIDLRVDYQRGKNRVHLTGQVLHASDPSKNFEDVGIAVKSGEKVAAETVAAASGEFNLEFGREDQLNLFVNARGYESICIRLPYLSKGYLPPTGNDE